MYERNHFFHKITCVFDVIGLKPKKCFTPPPDFKGSAGSSEEESDEEDDEEEDDEEEEESETEDGVVKSSYKVKDEFLEQVIIIIFIRFYFLVRSTYKEMVFRKLDKIY